MRVSFTKWPDAVILTIALLLLVHNINAPHTLLHSHSIDEYAARIGSLKKEVGGILLAVYGLFAIITTRQRSFSFRTLTGVSAVIFFTLATISVAWSSSPALSASRWFGFFSVTLAAAGAAKRLGNLGIIRWFFFAELFYLAAGVANELRLGTLHPFAAGYRFQGINDGNSTGAEAVILLFASLAMLRRVPSSWLYRTGFAAAIAVMLMTRSRTAIVSCILATAIVYGISYFRGRTLALYCYSLTLCMVALVAALSTDFLGADALTSVGRPDASTDTWTGRVPLWTQLYQDYVEDHPVAGYGYGAFWTEARIKEISYDQKWSIAAAHSIYLDSLLSLGFVGGLLYLVTLLSLLVAALHVARRDRDAGVFWACIVCALLIDGVSDSGPWYIASMYFFASVEAVFVICSVNSHANSVQPAYLKALSSRRESLRVHV